MAFLRCQVSLLENKIKSMHFPISLLLSSLVLLAILARASANARVDEELAPIVKVTGGLVRGIVQKSEEGKKVYLYNGLRYGELKRLQFNVGINLKLMPCNRQSWSV